MARVAEIGYHEVEFAGYFGHTPAEIRRALDAAGLEAPSAHVSVDALTDDWAATVQRAGEIGHRYLVVPSLPERMRRTLDDWWRTAELFNRAARTAADAGIRFAYHNHDVEFVPMEGRIPLDALCEATDPDLVQIELDVFWIVHGGGDPLAFFSRWPGRVPMVHLKDRTSEGRMVDVGAGAIDWRAIVARRAEAGIRHYFVEHDQPTDPYASVAASHAYLSALDV